MKGPASSRATGSQDAENELYRLQAEFCRGMAHPKRILILDLLKGGEMTVNQIAKLTGIPQANLSQHLSVLRQLGLLEARRSGQNVYYGISDMRIVEACDLVRRTIGERLKRARVAIEVVGR